MAGTTSIASRVAQLKRLKQDASPKSKRSAYDFSAGGDTGNDVLMSVVDDGDTGFAPPIESPAAHGDPIHHGTLSENHSASLDDAAARGAVGPNADFSEADDTRSEFLLVDENPVADFDDSWDGDAGAFDAGEVDEPDEQEEAPRPTPSFDDFTQAYDAAAPDDEAAATVATEPQNHAELPMDDIEAELNTTEFEDDDRFSAAEEAAFLADFEAESGDDFDIETPTLSETEPPVDDDAGALELSETADLSNEQSSDVVQVLPDFAARDVDELVLANELEDEPSFDDASEAFTPTAADGTEAPFSTENAGGEVAVTFDTQRSISLKEFSRDMNCSIEDIVVTALDWYLDALFNEEEEARSA